MDQDFEPLVDERLAQAVRQVLRSVPFYASYDPEAELSSLPVLRRDALLGTQPTQFIPAGLDVAAALAAGTLRPLTTSGSTDEPLKVYADLELQLPPSTWSMHGLPEAARLVNLTSGVCLGTSCPGDIAPYGADGLLLTFRAGLFEASDAHIARAVSAFNAFAPDIAFVNPVWLHWLHRRASERSLVLHQPRLLVFTYQYPSRCQRRALARAFHAPQVEFYGASEFGGTDLAIGCPEGHLHLVDYQAFVETSPSRHAGLDELVFTTPLSKAMPLLRYAPGDLGRVGFAGQDECALWNAPVLELDGRVDDVMHPGERAVTTREFDDAVGEVDGLEFYEARFGNGELSMKGITTRGAQREVEAALRPQVAALGFARFTFTPVERLALGPSGKLRLTGEDDRNALDLRP